MHIPARYRFMHSVRRRPCRCCYKDSSRREGCCVFDLLLYCGTSRLYAGRYAIPAPVCQRKAAHDAGTDPDLHTDALHLVDADVCDGDRSLHHAADLCRKRSGKAAEAEGHPGSEYEIRDKK